MSLANQFEFIHVSTTTNALLVIDIHIWIKDLKFNIYMFINN